LKTSNIFATQTDVQKNKKKQNSQQKNILLKPR